MTRQPSKEQYAMTEVTDPTITSTAITSTPTVLNNEPSCGAPKGWRWGYLPCGCRSDGYGNHINLRTSRLDEADAWAAQNGSRDTRPEETP